MEEMEKENGLGGHELETLFKISQVIQSSVGTEVVFGLVLDLLEELVEFEFAALFINDETEQKL